ncbi:unnamed protein product, partial [Mesorhabditis belari]|uniref:Uncharacterized protein n=1 Tax=Mesorhabditis belari TaxID=2138241 RepID=A0AAF3J348_9BILA
MDDMTNDINMDPDELRELPRRMSSGWEENVKDRRKNVSEKDAFQSDNRKTKLDPITMPMGRRDPKNNEQKDLGSKSLKYCHNCHNDHVDIHRFSLPELIALRWEDVTDGEEQLLVRKAKNDQDVKGRSMLVHLLFKTHTLWKKWLNNGVCLPRTARTQRGGKRHLEILWMEQLHVALTLG